MFFLDPLEDIERKEDTGIPVSIVPPRPYRSTNSPKVCLIRNVYAHCLLRRLWSKQCAYTFLI
jgi:hypothetical protein